MVRPKERYRHGARRQIAATQLDPVFVITLPGSYSSVDPEGAGRIYEVYSGQSGKLTEFAPWQFNPPEQVENTDAGAAAAIAALYNSLPYTTVEDSLWTGIRRYNTVPVFVQLLNDVVYVCLIRANYAQGQVLTTVTTTLPPSFAPVTTERLSNGTFFTRAIYDIVTVAVDLQTGEISHSSSPLYNWSVTITGTASGGGNQVERFNHTRREVYTGYIEAIAASLPDSHPFKDCGTVPWSFLSNLSIPLGTTEQAYTNTALPVPRYPWNFVFSQPSAAARLNRLKGYSSATQQRILGGLIYERSDLSSGWLSCEGYSLLGEYTEDSFSDYNAADLTPRDGLLRVDGYINAFQEKLLQESSNTDVQAMPSRVTGFPTSERLYFRSFDPSDPPSFLVRPNGDMKTFWDLYWIID